jgi:hypothetical protein
MAVKMAVSLGFVKDYICSCLHESCWHQVRVPANEKLVACDSLSQRRELPAEKKNHTIQVSTTCHRRCGPATFGGEDDTIYQMT